MKVLFLTNTPSPYRMKFFEELGKKCTLTVLFETQYAKSRNELWRANIQDQSFKSIFLRGIRIGDAEAFCLNVVKYLEKERYDVIVIGMYSTPTAILAIEYLRIKGIPFVINTDGGYPDTTRGLKHRFKAHLISSASLWLGTGRNAFDYFVSLGAKPKRIFTYPFTSVEQSEVLEQPIALETKLRIRKQLGIREKYVVLSVGQFIHRKGFDLLLNTTRELNQDIGVYIVGGDPDAKMKQILDEQPANKHTINFLTSEELTLYYKAADLFVLPTREDIWGLVINEAMARGLPVITTDACIAGKEMVTEENGKIVPVDVNWKGVIETFFAKSELQRFKESETALETASKYTIEKMAETCFKALSFMKEDSRYKQHLGSQR